MGRLARVLPIGFGVVATLLVGFGSLCGLGMTAERYCSVGVCSNGVTGARMLLIPTALPLLALVGLAARRRASDRSITLEVLALLATLVYGLAWVEHFEDVARLEECCPAE